jgi:hypothetical protein
MNLFRKFLSAAKHEEGHAYAWGGGSLLTILLIVVILIILF